ncbi:MAG: hypothetical protein EOP83_16285 [Verrucomicrobiaceae bacterium]|nr:MAG: hypothetical protein EOP83_16285 [Verrucomicrobiaceae bacterium]
MPLKVTHEDRIVEAIHVAKTFRGSPGQTLVAVLNAIGTDIGSATHLDAIWAEYYASQALAENARLNAEIARLEGSIADYETKF